MKPGNTGEGWGNETGKGRKPIKFSSTRRQHRAPLGVNPAEEQVSEGMYPPAADCHWLKVIFGVYLSLTLADPMRELRAKYVPALRKENPLRHGHKRAVGGEMGMTWGSR